MERTQNTSVFVVEDSPDVRDALVDLLECLPAVTVAGSAEDAATAITAIARCRPDVVVLDFQLAAGNALDVLRALHPTLLETSFIVLTNHATEPYRRVCIEAGAHAFLDKAREFAKVKDVIAQVRAVS
jgi:DNA-binding NarL/FixJ family response regulator